MNNGRNSKIKPMGFDGAVISFTSDLSSEAASNLTRMVRDVAGQYHYNDSAALNNLRSRLYRAARSRRSREWAQEVLAEVAKAMERKATERREASAGVMAW